MFASRLLIGVASGDIAALRAYCASAAVPKDRSRAVVLTSAAWSCGLTIGPAFPVIFTPLGYPGLKLFGHVHFDMYTAPAWISALNNIISMILLHTIFKEEYNGVDQKDNKSEESDSTDLSQVKSKTNWLAITVCLISRFAFILDKRNLERGAITFGLFCMLLFHILTFPWPFWNNKLTYSISHANQTATEISGCYTQTYSWCPSTHQVPLVLYGFSMIVIMGMGFGGAFSSNNILYSKVLGYHDRNPIYGWFNSKDYWTNNCFDII
uniref:Uncharacterized protein n=1 Tax=Acrobeloides nanus TaxID=290746 RepID=A0A914C238_9BILA